MSDSCCSGASCESTQPVAEAVGPTDPSLPSYRIHGMDCAEEVAILQRVLAELIPPEQLSFDVLNGRMIPRVPVDSDALIRAVASTGMRAEPWSDEPIDAPGGWSQRDLLVVLSIGATLAGFTIHAVLEGPSAAIGSEGAGLAASVPLIARAVYAIAIAAGLWVVLPKAWYSARSLRPDMNLLMTIAVAGAVTIGEWFEAATVSALFALSLALEAWSIGRARRAVAALMSLAPDVVRVRSDHGDIHERAPAEVPVGSIFIVRPGERIGLDGAIQSGRTEVDQSPITGESMPVDKEVGDTVFAGTINGSGSIEVVSTHLAGETTLARIVHQVADSQANRSQSERFVERFARYYTPIVFVAAALTALLPPLLFGGEWSEWTYRSLVLLVIGCPCALVISTPVAIVASLAASARHGVLLKGGRVAELPGQIAVVAMDKTGTLTHGQPRVTEVVPWGSTTESTLLAHAAALEAHSTHPLGRAILDRAAELGVDGDSATDVVAVHGKGIEGRIAGVDCWLGSHRWLSERGLETPELSERLTALASTGRSVVVVGSGSDVYGLIAVADSIRPESIDAIAALKRAGVSRIAMLTGDNRATAESIGAEVGVDEVLAELLPEDKVAAVERLEREYGPTAMIGDGVNDAPALARATLGIAMGAAGTDAAIETADIALMGDDLSKLAWLIDHSRSTLSIIRANTVLALGIKAVFVVLTFGGLASLWGAVAADIGASLLVVANALRLIRR